MVHWIACFPFEWLCDKYGFGLTTLNRESLLLLTLTETMCCRHYPRVRDDCAAAVVMSLEEQSRLPGPLPLETLGTTNNSFHASTCSISYFSEATFLGKD